MTESTSESAMAAPGPRATACRGVAVPPVPPVSRILHLPRIFKNAGANLLRLGSAWVALIVVTPLLTRWMPKPAYAVWMLVLQFGAYVAMLQGGLESCIGRFVARGESLGDQPYIRRMLLASVFVLGSCAALLILATGVAGSALPHFFPEIPASIIPSAVGALLVIGVAYSFALLGATLTGYFQGRQRYEVNTLAVTIGRVVGVVGVVAAAHRHQGLLAMAFWTALGVLVSPACLLFAWCRDPLRPAMLPLEFSWPAVWELCGFSWSMVVSLFGSFLITGLDLPIVAAFAFPATGFYAVAVGVSSMYAVPYTGALGAFLPAAAGLSATQSPQQLGEVLIRLTRYSTAILCVVGVAFLAGMNWFLRLWVGNTYASNSLLFASTLVGAQFVRLTMFPYSMIGFGAGQQGRMLLSPLGEGMVNLACSLVLVRIWGGFGVALGTFVGALVGIALHFFVSIPWTDCIAISRRKLLLSGVLRPLALTVPSLVLWLLVERTAAYQHYQLAGAVFLSAIALLVQLRWTLSVDEQTHLLSLVSRENRIISVSIPEI